MDELKESELATYVATVTETSAMEVQVEATSVQDAHRLVCDMWKAGEIQLGPDDFFDVSIDDIYRKKQR